MSSYNDKILTQELTEHRNDGEFDWEELELRLGEFHQANGSVTAEESKRLAFALSIILDWLICENLTRKHGLRTIGKRAVSMAWVLNPKRFGEDASLHSLAKELGFKAANISPLTAEFSRLFSVFNKYQNHDWRKDNKHGDNSNSQEQENGEEADGSADDGVEATQARD